MEPNQIKGIQILQYLTLRHRQDQGVVTWLNMAAAHLFALALPLRPSPVTARTAVSVTMSQCFNEEKVETLFAGWFKSMAIQ